MFHLVSVACHWSDFPEAPDQMPKIMGTPAPQTPLCAASNITATPKTQLKKQKKTGGKKNLGTKLIQNIINKQKQAKIQEAPKPGDGAMEAPPAGDGAMEAPPPPP